MDLTVSSQSEWLKKWPAALQLDSLYAVPAP